MSPSDRGHRSTGVIDPPDLWSTVNSGTAVGSVDSRLAREPF
jgi:hypothetical protein